MSETAEVRRWERLGGAPAFGLLLTVRCGEDETAETVLDFLEPGWGMRPPPWAVPGQRRLVVQVGDELTLARLRRSLERARVIRGCWPVRTGCGR